MPLSDISALSTTEQSQYLSSVKAKANQTSAGGIDVSTETFLKLLVAQLQYQDPLNPQTDTAFVTQLAQMTQLEQMQNMYSSVSTSQALSYTGRYVLGSYQDPSTGLSSEFSGFVDSVALVGGQAYVVIGDDKYPADKVRQIFDTALFEQGSLQDAGSLIGKFVEASYTDEEGRQLRLSGIVSRLSSEDGLIYFWIGETGLPLSAISSIAAPPIEPEAGAEVQFPPEDGGEAPPADEGQED